MATRMATKPRARRTSSPLPLACESRSYCPGGGCRRGSVRHRFACLPCCGVATVAQRVRRVARRSGVEGRQWRKRNIPPRPRVRHGRASPSAASKGTAMPASIHPPVRLSIVLDEESYREGGDQLARRFGAVAPTEVVRADKGSQRANVLRFDVGDDAVTAGADVDALWRDALASWLDEEFAETSALAARENDARRVNGARPVSFTWAEVRFGTGPGHRRPHEGIRHPRRGGGFVARARALLAAGGVRLRYRRRHPHPPRAPASLPSARTRVWPPGRPRPHPARTSRCARSDARSAVPRRRATSSRLSKLRRVPTACPRVETRRPTPTARTPGPPTKSNATSRRARRSTRRLPRPRRALRRGADPVSVALEGRGADAQHGASRASDGASAAAGRQRAAAEEPAPSLVAADPNAEACALVDEDAPESLDYRIWNVAYADGTSVRYDSVLGEALLD